MASLARDEGSEQYPRAPSEHLDRHGPEWVPREGLGEEWSDSRLVGASRPSSHRPCRGRRVTGAASRRGPLLALVAIVLAALAAFAALKLTSGAGDAGVTLANLAREQQAYLGDEVTTSGIVRRFTDPNGSSYYMLTDARADRVILRPAATARRYRSQHVTATGRFGFDPGAGRVLRVRRIEATPPGAR